MIVLILHQGSAGGGGRGGGRGNLRGGIGNAPSSRGLGIPRLRGAR